MDDYLERYKLEYDIDTIKMDRVNVADKIASHPNIWHKWWTRRCQHKYEAALLRRELSDYIKSEVAKVQKKTDLSSNKIQYMINNTDEVLSRTSKIEDLEFIVEYLDGIMKGLYTSSFLYKDYLSWIKHFSGEH